MMANSHQTQQTRKTRIVCISDTHGQTPKLPRGDVLIHAGDLTNQGSYPELKKTVEWLEKADFEAKIVVAGNHELTLDTEFFKENESSRRWPEPQDPNACRKLLTESKSITYLENEAAFIYLDAPNGPHTCFKVFGSPYSPNNRNWAFRYKPQESMGFWDIIPSDADVVVTHTPPKGHCDTATKDDRVGCEALLHALHRVRPMLSVFGHIHEARGVERVLWNLQTPGAGKLVEAVEVWKDPGAGCNKQSLVNLSAKGGRGLGNCSRLTRQSNVSKLLNRGVGDFGGQPDVPGSLQPSVFNSTSRLGGDSYSEAKGRARPMLGGAIAYRQGTAPSDIGLDNELGQEHNVEAVERKETAMVNAAFLGPRIVGKAMEFSKPIVVDVDLPVWSFEKNAA